MTKRSQNIITALTLLVITLPYLMAAWGGGDNFVFDGFLVNPLDGNSYLAKMRLGYDGNWQFSLPFYEKEMDGPFLFLFYIFLGHVARILNLSLIISFHIARIVCAFIFCVFLAKFIKVILPGMSGKNQTFAYGLTLFGSGLGWLAAFFGGFTSDFWVAEAYPFLSMYSNPHFPLGIALLLGFFISLEEQPAGRRLVWLAIIGILEAIILPFAVVIAVVIAVMHQIWDFALNKNKIRLWPLIFLVPAGIFLLYQFIAIAKNPILTLWNEQNVTLSPHLGDLLISFSPAFVVSLCVLFVLWKQKMLGRNKVLIIWMISGLMLAYFPFQLQRRFLLGYYIPLSILSSQLFDFGISTHKKFSYFGKIILFTTSILTNILILAGGLNAISNKDLSIYYSKDIHSGFDWMDEQIDLSPLVLAAPETSLLIPGRTGWRVIYGHPYETPNAEIRKAEVESIITKNLTKQVLEDYIEDHEIEYVFWGPIETMRSGQAFRLESTSIVYSNKSVKIFKTGFGK